MPRKKRPAQETIVQNSDPDDEWEHLEVETVHIVSGCHSLDGKFHEINEDASTIHQLDDLLYLAVFDGHSAQDNMGSEASQFSRNNLHWELAKNLHSASSLEASLVEAFVQTDHQFVVQAEKRQSDAGCCALVALIKGRHLLLGNAGDCRAVLWDGSNARQVTTDHTFKCPAEKARVEALGGYFVEGRVFGDLEPTRGFGDVEIRHQQIALWEDLLRKRSTSSVGPVVPAGLVFPLKSVVEMPVESLAVSPLPDVRHAALPVISEGRLCFLILATDGVWQTLKNQEACDVALAALQAPGKAHAAVRAQAAARAVCQAARRSPLSYDDITAIVVWFY